jgi:hypothetical protein
MEKPQSKNGKMKNYTESCKETSASPVSVLTKKEQQEALSPSGDTVRLSKVESAVDESIVNSRLESAYAKMTPEEIKGLSWFSKILIAQGKVDEVEAPNAKRGAAPINLTEACRKAKQNA